MIIRNKIFENDMIEIDNSFDGIKDLRGKTILITGATGMLASYFTAFLFWLNEKHNYNIDVIVFVRNKSKFQNMFESFNYYPYCKVFENNSMDCSRLNCNIDYVIHAASIANPKFYSTNPVDVMVPNIIGTYNLLEFSKINMNNDGAFLFFSSGDIYGKPINNDIISESNVGSIDPLDIHSCYGESKRAGETLCMSYFKQYNVPVKIARICHTYAPTVDLKNDPRVFSSFVNNVLNDNDIVMNSDGSGIRAFLYITDAILAFLIILIKGKSGEAYNVSNCNQKYTILELAKHIVDISSNKKLKVIRKEREIGDTYIENMCQVGVDSVPSDIKLRKLGWEPKISIDEGFKRVIEYYL